VKAQFKTASGYQGDNMKLPVADVDAAIPFYETIMGFRVASRSETPYKSAVLARDGIQIGLAENGGDPTQDGCFFEVDDIEAAFVEVQGVAPSESALEYQVFYGTTFRVFFHVAPDGLCYMFGQRET